MADNIIDLAAHGWKVGKVGCSNCRHKWVAVRPVGTHNLECPKCNTTTNVTIIKLQANKEK